jgi:hypothetical protein
LEGVLTGMRAELDIAIKSILWGLEKSVDSDQEFRKFALQCSGDSAWRSSQLSGNLLLFVPALMPSHLQPNDGRIERFVLLIVAGGLHIFPVNK